MAIQNLRLSMLRGITFREKESVEKTGNPVILTVEDFVSRIKDKQPEIETMLRVFPLECPFIRLFLYEEQVRVGIPQIYKNEEGLVELFDVQEVARPIAIESKWIDYTINWSRNQDPKKTIVTGEQSFVVKKEDSFFQYSCPIGLSNEYISDIRRKQDSITEEILLSGKGLIESKYVRYFPRSFKSTEEFEENGDYRIKGIALENDPRFNTRRFLIAKLEEDREIEVFEALASYALNDHWENFKTEPFRVTEKKKKESGWTMKLILPGFAEVI